MATTNLKLFERANEQLKKNMQTSFEEYEIPLSDLMTRLEIANEFAQIITAHEASKVFVEVCYDLFSSIFLSLNGIYRNGCGALRSACELGLSFFYFFDYNYHFKRWINNTFDITWSKLSDCEEGILSEKYLSINLPFECHETFIEDYKQLYRQCSEYVHGKYNYMHTVDDSQIVFDKKDMDNFLKLFVSLTDCLFTIMILRFNYILPQFKEDHFEYLKEVSKKYSLYNSFPEYGK